MVVLPTYFVVGCTSPPHSHHISPLKLPSVNPPVSPTSPPRLFDPPVSPASPNSNPPMSPSCFNRARSSIVPSTPQATSPGYFVPHSPCSQKHLYYSHSPSPPPSQSILDSPSVLVQETQFSDSDATLPPVERIQETQMIEGEGGIFYVHTTHLP